MTTALALVINDLALSKELDKSAMRKVFGGHPSGTREGYQFNGYSSISETGFQYTGNHFANFLGNVWFNGKWTKKFNTGYEYKNVQTRWNYFNEWWS